MVLLKKNQLGPCKTFDPNSEQHDSPRFLFEKEPEARKGFKVGASDGLGFDFDFCAVFQQKAVRLLPLHEFCQEAFKLPKSPFADCNHHDTAPACSPARRRFYRQIFAFDWKPK